jgi:hypothetical protein
MRAAVTAALENGDLALKPRDIMAFMELDARLGEERAAARAELTMKQARTFGKAVRAVIPQELHEQILETYDRLISLQGLDDPRAMLEDADDEQA